MTLCFRYTSFALRGQASQHISSFPTQCDTVLFPLQHLLSECSSYTIHCPFYMCQNARGKQPFPPSRCSGSLYITPCQVLEPHCPFHRSECSRYSVLPQPCQRNAVLSPFYSIPGKLSSLLCQNAQRTLFFHNFIMLEVLYPFFTVRGALSFHPVSECSIYTVHTPFSQCKMGCLVSAYMGYTVLSLSVRVLRVLCPFPSQITHSTLTIPYSYSVMCAVWCQRAWVILPSAPSVREHGVYCPLCILSLQDTKSIAWCERAWATLSFLLPVPDCSRYIALFLCAVVSDANFVIFWQNKITSNFTSKVLGHPPSGNSVWGWSE